MTLNLMYIFKVPVVLPAMRGFCRGHQHSQVLRGQPCVQVINSGTYILYYFLLLQCAQ
jgi:hypothetical protein